MGGEVRTVEFMARTHDTDHWPTDALAAADIAKSSVEDVDTAHDWAFGQLEGAIRRAGERFAAAHPDVFDAPFLGTEPQEVDPHLDDIPRADLPELGGPAADVAAALDGWLHERMASGTLDAAHGVGTFLDLLAASGWRVEPIEAPDPATLLPPATD